MAVGKIVFKDKQNNKQSSKDMIFFLLFLSKAKTVALEECMVLQTCRDESLQGL